MKVIVGGSYVRRLVGLLLAASVFSVKGLGASEQCVVGALGCAVLGVLYVLVWCVFLLVQDPH